MSHITGEERNQLIMISLEAVVSKESFVRVIDAFVNAIDLESFGFSHVCCKEEGRPPYHPSILMKLYLYGYRYGIRSSRKLEREASLNLEAMWLTMCQSPKYKTIANFRKNHSKAFREVFRSFVRLLRDWELADGKTIAIDSFKIRGQNSLKNNLNQAKIDRHLEYIDNKVAEYECQLNQCDQEEGRQELEAKIEQQNLRKEGYLEVQEELAKSGQEQISLTDPDARSVVLHRNIVNVGYNIQASSDSKHKLLVEFETGDVNDSHSLAQMASATKEILQSEEMDVLADKGYHYTCPAGETLTTNNVWYKHSSKGRNEAYQFLRYTTSACKTCASRSRCTSGKQNGRAIDRSEYAEAIEANRERVIANPGYYRQRQQITEHPFGTLKRQRGFTFTLMKGKEKVLGEVGLEFIGYNLTRCASILGIAELCKALKQCFFALFCLFHNPFSGLFSESILQNSQQQFFPIINYCLLNPSR